MRAPTRATGPPAFIGTRGARRRPSTILRSRGSGAPLIPRTLYALCCPSIRPPRRILMRITFVTPALVGAATLLLAAVPKATDPALARITPERLRAHVRFLSDDLL